MMDISKTLAMRILKEEGAERVSSPAAMEFAENMSKNAHLLARKAVKLAAHAKRKTIQKADIDLAK